MVRAASKSTTTQSRTAVSIAICIRLSSEIYIYIYLNWNFHNRNTTIHQLSLSLMYDIYLAFSVDVMDLWCSRNLFLSSSVVLLSPPRLDALRRLDLPPPSLHRSLSSLSRSLSLPLPLNISFPPASRCACLWSDLIPSKAFGR